jgi:Zn-dependent metalloprotease
MRKGFFGQRLSGIALLLLPAALFAQSSYRDEGVKSAIALKSKQALHKFQSKSEGSWIVSMNKETGIPRMLMGAKSCSYGATPIEAAEAFSDENVDVFLPGNSQKMKGEKIVLKVASSKTLPGSTVVEFREEYKSIPVYGTSHIVMVDSSGRVVHVTSTVDPRVEVSTTPARTFQQIDAEFRNSRTNNNVTAVGNALVVIFPGETPRLAYQVFYDIGDPIEPWEYILDAETGKVLKAKRLVKDQKKRLDEAAVSQQTQRVQKEDNQKLGQKSTSDKPLAVYKVHVDLKTGNTTTKKVGESGAELYSNTEASNYSTDPQASEKRKVLGE